MVPVGCSDLFISIYWFSWSKISFKFFVKSFFCWLLTFVYHIHWISIHWSWNLYSGVLANFQWAVSKPDIQSCFLRSFVRDIGKIAGVFDSTCRHQYINQVKYPQIIQVCSCVDRCWPKGNKGPLDWSLSIILWVI